MSINLIPSYVVNRCRYQNLVRFIVFIVNLILILTAIVIVFNIERSSMTARHNILYLRQQLALISVPKNYNVVFKKYQRVSRGDSRLLQHVKLINLLHLIDKNSIGKIKLNSIQFANKQLNLQGLAASYSELNNIFMRVKQSKLITKAQFNLSREPQDVGSSQLLRFKMELFF